MKYIIYGINRVAKDFLYIFDQLDIVCLADDRVEGKAFCGLPAKTIEEALVDNSYDKIILCDFDKTAKEQRLQECGLRRGQDYLYEEDFFPSLDDFHIPPGKRIAVWGTGQMAQAFTEWNCEYGHYGIQLYLDNHKTKDTFCGLSVLSPEESVDWKDWFIIVAVARDTEIRAQLAGYGLEPGKDFISYHKIMGQPSHMLRRTIFDRAYYDLDCRTMLNHLEILHEGDTRCCCTTFVSQNLDNIMEKDAGSLWHSALHKIMCLSTENRTYSFCDKSMCPLFVGRKAAETAGTAATAGTEGRTDAVDAERPYRQMSAAPEVLALGHDPSCNLACSTCRKEIYFAQGKALEKVRQVTQKVKEEYLPGCRFLILAGDGEVFASPAYREIYKDPSCRPAYIRLLSNGMLFTPANWECFAAGRAAKVMLTVSVDAATKETYENIRQNGNFDILMKNMEFAAALRKSGELAYFRMNFVVQRENYREMPLFVEWGEKLGVDEVFFTKILNWGTYTPEKFAGISMMEADGVTPKPELAEVLAAPAMKSGIVDLGTIQYAHREDAAENVENYYMWELEKRGGKLFS